MSGHNYPTFLTIEYIIVKIVSFISTNFRNSDKYEAILVEPSHSGFTGFYFIAVHPKEAIMAGNMVRLTTERKPQCSKLKMKHL